MVASDCAKEFENTEFSESFLWFILRLLGLDDFLLNITPGRGNLKFCSSSFSEDDDDEDVLFLSIIEKRQLFCFKADSYAILVQVILRIFMEASRYLVPNIIRFGLNRVSIKNTK